VRVRLSVAIALLLVAALAPAAPVRYAQALDALDTHTYTVNSSADAHDYDPSDRVCGNPTIPGTCTLRAALEESDGDGTMSYILFAQPMTITLNDALGPLIEYQAHNETFIDASALWQGAWPAGRPGVRVDASVAVGVLSIRGSWVHVYGIEFGAGLGIIGGSDNRIGGADSGQRNVFVRDSLAIQPNGAVRAQRNHIIGNYFGTEDGLTPTTPVLFLGIYLHDADHNVVDGNLIANVMPQGVNPAVYLNSSNGNTISNNVIGLNAAQLAALPNSYGMNLTDASDNTIGPGNVIAGNTGLGIAVYGTSTGNTISDSVIGKHGLGNGAMGILVDAGPGNTVTGCTIVGNGSDGIYVSGGTGTIVTANTIGENGGSGIHFGGGSGTAAANYVGMDASGADLGNTGYGILVESGGNVIGTSVSSPRQWVGFNDLDGIRLSGANAVDNTVDYNVVGMTPSGQQALNGHHGISAYDVGAGNDIGPSGGPGNVVMGTGWSGIVLVNANGVSVQRNHVGTDGAGNNWGNGWYGIAVVNGSHNTIRRNEVTYSGAHAGEAGVWVQGATSVGNWLSQNSIHDNGGPGIALGAGANAGIAAPVVTQSSCGGAVDGLSASGTACAGCSVELFADGADEGRTYLGGATADGAGAWSWSGPAGGPALTATATDAAGNTSPFSTAASACRLVSLPLVRQR
jgi:parallel beta-helix repeat protein